jgi:hypothetical protein
MTPDDRDRLRALAERAQEKADALQVFPTIVLRPDTLLALLDDLRDAEARVARARIVADLWRRAALNWGEAPMPGRLSAHPLCLVLDALDGETDPARLGVSAGADFDALAALAPDETGGSGG